LGFSYHLHVYEIGLGIFSHSRNCGMKLICLKNFFTLVKILS